MWYVYVITSDEKKNYIGFTNDVEQRLKEHNSGKDTYTKGKNWKLAYYECR